MASVTMMRCTVPHWQGMDYIAAGTILPEGHAQIIGLYFEPITYDTTDTPTPRKKAPTKKTA